MARASRPKRANNKKKFKNNNIIQVNKMRQEANPNFILKQLFEKGWFMIEGEPYTEEERKSIKEETAIFADELEKEMARQMAPEKRGNKKAMP